jgi:hypothetical protein
LVRAAEKEKGQAAREVDRLTEELALEKAQWKKRTVREQEQNAARDMQRHGELITKVSRECAARLNRCRGCSEFGALGWVAHGRARSHRPIPPVLREGWTQLDKAETAVSVYRDAAAGAMAEKSRLEAALGDAQAATAVAERAAAAAHSDRQVQHNPAQYCYRFSPGRAGLRFQGGKGG